MLWRSMPLLLAAAKRMNEHGELLDGRIAYAGQPRHPRSAQLHVSLNRSRYSDLCAPERRTALKDERPHLKRPPPSACRHVPE
jgi:hypothetical protein